MAEFVDVVLHGVDLCKSHPDSCRGCEIFACHEDLWDSNCPFEKWFGKADLNRMEKTIENWAENKPIPKYPSWRSWWMSQFPDSKEVPCPQKYFGVPCEHITLHACGRCLDKEIPENIAIKLKIKPFTEGRD